LPSLADLRSEYSHEVNAELVYELCAALVREGLGTAESWNQSGGNALQFAQHAMMSGIGAERGDLIQRNVEYHLEVSDQLGRAGSDAKLECGQLVLTIECGGSGYFKIGPALDRLEAEAEGLGAAFYWALTLAIYRVMRIYNHDDALMYEERMRDYAAEDEEENHAQYEFPEVEKALPECIRKTLKRESPDWKMPDRDLLRRFRDGKFGSWFEKLRRIQRLSRLPLKQAREYLELGYYDEPPLPSLLVTFKEHDAITACFDEEGQYMMEGTAEPTVCVVFSPRKPDEVRYAMRVVDRFVALNCELFQLVEVIQEWEKSHAGTSVNRGEPSLRAALGAADLSRQAKQFHHPTRRYRPEGCATHSRAGAAAHCGIHRVTDALPRRQCAGRGAAGEHLS